MYGVMHIATERENDSAPGRKSLERDTIKSLFDVAAYNIIIIIFIIYPYTRIKTHFGYLYCTIHIDEVYFTPTRRLSHVFIAVHVRRIKLSRRISGGFVYILYAGNPIRVRVTFVVVLNNVYTPRVSITRTMTSRIYPFSCGIYI